MDFEVTKLFEQLSAYAGQRSSPRPEWFSKRDRTLLPWAILTFVAAAIFSVCSRFANPRTANVLIILAYLSVLITQILSLVATLQTTVSSFKSSLPLIRDPIKE